MEGWRFTDNYKEVMNGMFSPASGCRMNVKSKTNIMKVTEPVLKIPVTEIFSPQDKNVAYQQNGKIRGMPVSVQTICGAWLHNSRVFGTSMNGVSIYGDGARDIGEINMVVLANDNAKVVIPG